MISILTPSRRRPDNIKRLLLSIGNTMSGEIPIEVTFRIDETDESLNNDEFTESIFDACKAKLTPQFLVGKETFPDLGCLWNECFEVCSGDLIMCGADDLVYDTENWDQKVVNIFNDQADKILLVYGNDGVFGTSLATHPILSRKAVEATGWFFPPIGLTYANDNFLYNLYYRLKRLHFVGELSIRHHWTGDGEDPNYGRMGNHFDRSHAILASDMGQMCMREAEIKLREVMK